MLYYLDLCSDGDGNYGFGDGDGTTCYEEPHTTQTRSHTTADGITPYAHEAAPYPLDAVDLLTRLAAREAVQPATTTGEHHGIR
jgi:hypothetical protein